MSLVLKTTGCMSSSWPWTSRSRTHLWSSSGGGRVSGFAAGALWAWRKAVAAAYTIKLMNVPRQLRG